MGGVGKGQRGNFLFLDTEINLNYKWKEVA